MFILFFLFAQSCQASEVFLQVPREEETFYALKGYEVVASNPDAHLIGVGAPDHPILTMKRKAKPPQYELCILGCWASGTRYVADCFSAWGVPIGHEWMGPNGYIGWPFAIGTYFWKKEQIAFPCFKHIAHQVRDPLSFIYTCSKENPENWEQSHREWTFIMKKIPEIKRDDPLIVRLAKCWYYWNLKIEKVAEYRYRVEDIASALPYFSSLFHIPFSPKVLTSTPRSLNRSPWDCEPRLKKVTWLLLKRHLSKELYENMRAMAIRYGYSIDEKK